MGGGGDTPEQTQLLHDYVLALTRPERPRIMWVPTAILEMPSGFEAFHDRFGSRGELTNLRTFPWPPENLRDLILGQDAICVSGGSTANMLAIWRVHGIDRLLREAWENGTVLFGASAGMICWFQDGLCDSLGDLHRLNDGLGFVRGSACPHYGGDSGGPEAFRKMIARGARVGYAAEDGVAFHFTGTRLRKAVSSRADGRAYRVVKKRGKVVEEPLAVRYLGK